MPQLSGQTVLGVAIESGVEDVENVPICHFASAFADCERHARIQFADVVLRPEESQRGEDRVAGGDPIDVVSVGSIPIVAGVVKLRTIARFHGRNSPAVFSGKEREFCFERRLQFTRHLGRLTEFQYDRTVARTGIPTYLATLATSMPGSSGIFNVASGRLWLGKDDSRWWNRLIS